MDVRTARAFVLLVAYYTTTPAGGEAVRAADQAARRAVELMRTRAYLAATCEGRCVNAQCPRCFPPVVAPPA